jgi:threonine aldolase
MRQSGILAAAGLYALEHQVGRLADDHRRARQLAEGLLELPQLVVERVPLRTNMVFFEVPDRHSPDQLEQGLAADNIRLSRMHARRFRAVTHLDFDDHQLEQVLRAFRRLVPKL